MMIEQPLGPLIVGIDGLELDSTSRAALTHPAVGGVILFARNYRSPDQLKTLTKEIRALRTPRLLVAVDQEGGRVQRFKAGFTRLPPPAVLGRWHERQPDRARDLAYRHGRVMAAEVLGHGVDISLAPVLDLDRGSAAIGNRAFSSDPEVVVDLVSWYLAGMKDAGMRTCGKHFPGHGSVAADSHHGVVTDDRTLEEMEPDLSTFRQFSPQLDSIMMTHVRYPAVDEHPAGFSPFWINDVLRGRMGFEKLVLTDDLCMAGAAAGGELARRVNAALDAGCSAALVCCPESVRTLLADPALLHNRTAGLDALYGRPMASLEEQSQVPELQAWRDSLEALYRHSGTA